MRPFHLWSGALTAGLAGVLLGACTTTSAFSCTEDSECLLSGIQGICEPSGACSFPDPQCDSGRRYGEFGAGVGGECVAGDGPSTSEVATGTMTGSGSTTATTTTTDTATTSMCSELGGACAQSADCCNPCMVCADDICVADVGAAGACATCEACDQDAACAPVDEGSTCLFDCDQLVWGATGDETSVSCHRYTPAQVPGTCGALRECLVDNQKDCADAPGEVIVSCDAACERPMATCAQGAPAGSISVEDLCAVGEESPGCGSSCVDGVALVQGCDEVGACIVTEMTECTPYVCAMGACVTDCKNSMDCAEGFSCVEKSCQ